jgi:hypothetical protein
MDRGWVKSFFDGISARVWLSQFQDKIWRLTRSLRYASTRHKPDGRPTILFMYYPNAIAESQLYPFHLYRKTLLKRLGLRVIAVPLASASKLNIVDFSNVKLVAIQTHFRISPEQLVDILSLIRTTFHSAQIVYFDWFAPSDLRLFSLIEPYVNRYVKKTVFVNYDQYRAPYFGDTNLMDYYGNLYPCDHQFHQYQIPKSVDKKLMTGVGFISSPYLHSLFSRSSLPEEGDRPIDVNARFATRGSGWYLAMRSEALNAALSLSPEYLVVSGSISRAKYLIELGSSKLTFSPFGYGEICWRDYEAIALGSLLIKPDMGHLKVNPDIFVPYETYIPVAWDFSDFEEKVVYYLNHPEERARITKNAFAVGSQFVRKKAFVDHVNELIEPVF